MILNKNVINYKMLLPPSQIISYSKNLGELKHLKFNQNYRKSYKIYNIKIIYYKNIINEEPNDT
jgi:hypothetical protein